jgi:hypothetical protein
LLWVLLAVAMGAATVLLIWPTAVQAQTAAGISQPAAGDVIGGVVIIEGTASDPNFLRYEVAFWQNANPGAGWIVFAEGERPVVAGTLAIWDTTIGRTANAPVFPDGVYQLRLRIVRTDYNYSEYFVSDLLLSNSQPTPTPTITATETTTVTAVPDSLLPSPTVAPAILPSLTPFPTPSPPATPALDPLLARPGATAGDSDERQGLLAQLQSIEFTRFGRAFRQGVTFTFYLFVIVCLYLAARRLWRRLWRLARRL